MSISVFIAVAAAQVLSDAEVRATVREMQSQCADLYSSAYQCACDVGFIGASVPRETLYLLAAPDGATFDRRVKRLGYSEPKLERIFGSLEDLKPSADLICESFSRWRGFAAFEETGLARTASTSLPAVKGYTRVVLERAAFHLDTLRAP